MSASILTRAEIDSLTREEAEVYLNKVLSFVKIQAGIIEPRYESLSISDAAEKVFELLAVLGNESRNLDCDLKDPTSSGVVHAREKAIALAYLLGSAILREHPDLYWGVGWEPPKQRYLFQNHPVIKGIKTASGEMDMPIFPHIEKFAYATLKGKLDQAKFSEFINHWISIIKNS